jgi:hypothetical protein
MPETKDKTLEEIDELFLMPTSKLVALNTSNLIKRFRPRRKPEQADTHNP